MVRKAVIIGLTFLAVGIALLTRTIAGRRSWHFGDPRRRDARYVVSGDRFNSDTVIWIAFRGRWRPLTARDEAERYRWSLVHKAHYWGQRKPDPNTRRFRWSKIDGYLKRSLKFDVWQEFNGERYYYTNPTVEADITFVSIRIPTRTLTLSLNTLSRALAAYPILAFIRGPVRRYRRAFRGLCPECAYSLKGLPTHAGMDGATLLSAGLRRKLARAARRSLNWFAYGACFGAVASLLLSTFRQVFPYSTLLDPGSLLSWIMLPAENLYLYHMAPIYVVNVVLLTALVGGSAFLWSAFPAYKRHLRKHRDGSESEDMSARCPECGLELWFSLPTFNSVQRTKGHE